MRLSELRRRGPRVPAEVRGRVEGRVLASAVTNDRTTWLLGTRDALVIAGGTTLTLPWERVERADWDQDSGRLRVFEVGTFGRPRPEHHFDVEDEGRLLELLRERVTASVLLQRWMPVSGSGKRQRGVRVVARRPPAGGEVEWFFEYDDTLEPDDPEVRAAADALLAQAQSEVG